MGSVHDDLAESFNVRSICIIGAGPSGLAAAKFLLAENAFDKVEIIEQQSQVGGVWNYSELSEKVPIPQTRPPATLDKPNWDPDQDAPQFSNPMYDDLHTNIPHKLMAFSDLPFPSGSLLFPRRKDVFKYLVRYAEDVRHLIKFSTQVESVVHSYKNQRDRWTVTTTSLITKDTSSIDFDAVVVASGHYSVGYVPHVPGIDIFNQTYPEVLSHCKSYRSPLSFRNKKVIVVGSGPSGTDIGTQISKSSQYPLLNSVRTSANFRVGQEKKEEIPPIAEYIVANRSVRLIDGRVEKDIDAVVYCTGYLYSYPFLKNLTPPVVTDGRRARNLYKQLFNITHPTLAFTALSQRIIPFPVSECQCSAIAKVWSNKLSLPSKEEMTFWEQQKVDELGDGTSFHFLGYPKDAEYINELYRWVGTARGGYAKEPAHWDTKSCWLRGNFLELRKRFVEAGSQAQSLEELGFDYDKCEISE